MDLCHTVNILEQCQVSPPSGSAPKTTIPLTYFDLAALCLDAPVYLHYFYSFKTTKTHFMQSIIPDMKQSLKFTLKHFYPLAGNLTWSLQSTAPEIICDEGDSVSFDAAESDFSFDHLTGHHPRETHVFTPLYHAFVPKKSSTDVVIYPLLAFRVTLFPNSGICVAISMNHAVGDGVAFNHFVRSWALVNNTLNGETSSLLSYNLPLFDKSTIIDPHGIQKSLLNYMEMINISQKSFNHPSDPAPPATSTRPKVVGTFVIDLANIEKLKKWVLHRYIEKYKKEPSFHITAHVVTLAYLWVCLTKVLDGNNVLDNSGEHILISADCRTRLNPPLPVKYFGNCITYIPATVGKNDMLLSGEDAIVIAAEAIGTTIKNLLKDVLAPAGTMVEKAFDLAASGRLTVLALTPRMGLYGMNFGWGNPKKVEIVSGVGNLEMIAMCENGENAKGALQFGITLAKPTMDAFTSIFENTLKNISTYKYSSKI